MTGLPPISMSGLGFRAVSSDSLVPNPPAKMATGGEAGRTAPGSFPVTLGKAWKGGATIVTRNSLRLWNAIRGVNYLIEKKRKEKDFLPLTSNAFAHKK
jgi:hypothetical protein